ncbi:hypothetical protein AGLY_017071 [Aphis glycines]|uniref:HAT C-terminal dimerisation domain-containing protein n=1 Tax=Aphis glycines TaxID=307491 RepID=A0A6G0SX39_APHGL|nr:hypothetical protein AGLY_017071 [Aphis glycines]
MFKACAWVPPPHFAFPKNIEGKQKRQANDFLINFESDGSKAVDVPIDKRKQQRIWFVVTNEIRSSLSGEQEVFRALLSFRVESGDTILMNHFETSPKNCTMISPRIQNEITIAAGDVLVGKIVERIKKFKFFSILVDETTDLSTVEQMTVCVRYIEYTSNWIIREDFAVISINNLRGQGYDGSANMSGKNNGAYALIKNDQPLAFYTHCFSHSLNLCFASAKRADQLKSVIEAFEVVTTNNSELGKKMKLKELCETRWAERHDALIIFKSLLHILSLEVTVTGFAYTLQFSLSLQKKFRENADENFKSIFKDIVEFAEKVNVEISMPRICGRQTQQVNVNVADSEIYFKISVYTPFLDYIIQALHTRFDDRLSDVMPLEGLIPSNFSFYDDISILKADIIYDKDLTNTDSSCLRAELHMWRCQWYSKDDKAQSIFDTLPHCTNLLPNIQVLLRLFGTLPITSATQERTFLTLKRLKSYLRSTMTQERLNGLAIENINKKENLTELEVLQQFSKTSPKRLQLYWTKKNV